MSGKAYRKKQKERKNFDKELSRKVKKLRIKKEELNSSHITKQYQEISNRKGDTRKIELKGICSICSFEGRTVRHHLAPAWTGNDNESNLIELCPRCHSKIHKIGEDILWIIFDHQRRELKDILLANLKLTVERDRKHDKK